MSVFFRRGGLGVAVLGAMLAAAQPASSAYPYWNGIGTLGPYRWIEQTGISYARSANGSTLDTVNICRPSPGSGQWAGPYPAILLLHGGAWSGGTNAISASYTGFSGSWCQIWASWGFVAYSVGYRLQDGNWGNAWPAQIVDTQAATRWVRARAQAGNPDHVNAAFIGAMGDSAGGSLALQVGALSAAISSPGDPVATTNAGYNPMVQFMIAQFAPYDWGPSSAVAPLPNLAIARAEPANGGKVSPAAALFIQGTQDTTVLPYESISAYCYMRQHGNPSHYASYVGGHEYSNIPNNQAPGVFNRIVGGMVNSAISFAFSIGHYAPAGRTPPVPLWFLGPQASFDVSPAPTCH